MDTASPALHAARIFGFQLQEYAKKSGMDYKGIRILNCREAKKMGFRHADSIVLWADGPLDWPYIFEIENFRNVSTNIEDGYMVVFYNQ